ncbi:MAG: hypothetical protein ING19_14030 [Azospirillum sp.]|nr:hypothetical protein [Azospirillum sp.]
MLTINERTLENIKRLKMAARRSDPDTAFSAMSQTEQTARMLRVYYDVLASGDRGTTSIETAIRRGMHHVTSSPAFAPLERIGAIVDSGYRRKNPKTGRWCVVWVAAGTRLDPDLPGLVKAPKSRPERRAGSRTPLVRDLMRIIAAYRMGDEKKARRLLGRTGIGAGI